MTRKDSQRVDFPLPERFNVVACRYCRAEIVWGQIGEAQRPHPFHYATRERRGGAIFAESHMAYCPKAAEARRRNRPARRLCRADGCETSIPATRLFCPDCGALIPKAIRGPLTVAWRERKSSGEPDRVLLQYIDRARRAIADRRAARAMTQGGLFGAALEASPSAIEDPG